MNKKTVGILAVVAGLVVICIMGVVGVVLFTVLRAPEEASEPIEAVPLEAVTVEAMPESAEPELPAEAEAENESDAAVANLTIFTIQQAGSQARFELDEELRGNPITVVGSTDQIAGEIGIDFNNPAATELGVIQVNARTLATDNDFRNRALRNEILVTGPFEYITFTPTEITGLPDTVAVGDTITFQVNGDLTITGISQPATFAVTVTIVSETEISGTASTVVTREAYNLRIPSVPAVANVEEEVEIYLDFVASAG